jgi:peptidoglycan/LPS O-acetylase OafA/YrhL
VDSPGTTKHIGYLDGWRALAILCVLVGHFIGVPGFNVARVGVELFFVLSGRLMAEILFTRQTDFKTFFLRRISRVWPALFAFLFAMAAVSLALKDPIPGVHLAGAVFFIQNYVSIYLGHIGRIDHIWSLSIEEWGYIGLAAVALLHRRLKIDPLVVLVLLIVAMSVNGIVQSLNGYNYYEVYWRTDVRAASILLGAVGYLVFRDRDVPWVIPVAAFAAGFLLNIDVVPDTVKYTVGTVLLAIALNSLGSAPTSVQSFLSTTPLRYIALVSFSLYLWQQPFFMFSGKINALLLVAGTVVAAVGSYLVVERPAKNFLNSRWPKKAPSRQELRPVTNDTSGF